MNISKIVRFIGRLCLKVNGKFTVLFSARFW